MKTYRICTYEVLPSGEQGALVDIVEAEAPELASGRNVFHLISDIEKRIAAESELAS